MNTMSSKGKGGPHNTKKGKGAVAGKRWLGHCAASFEAAPLAPTDHDEDDDDRLFFDPDDDDNVDAHGHVNLVSFPAEQVDYAVNDTDHHAHVTEPVPIPFRPRNDVVVLALAAPPYSRSAGSDASVNSYAVNAGEAEADRHDERENGFFEELWEVVDAAAGPMEEKLNMNE